MILRSWIIELPGLGTYECRRTAKSCKFASKEEKEDKTIAVPFVLELTEVAVLKMTGRSVPNAYF